ncbi:MAG: glycosyltransferase [Sphingobacteriaceae bacterium]|nr:glycosyltransferase [Sphingobacteriaceae bacterium]
MFCDETLSEGVISKVKSKISGLIKEGIDVKGLFINPNINKEEFSKEENIRYVPFVYKDLPNIYNRRYIRNYRWYFGYNDYIKQLFKLIGAELKKEKFDLILFRYPLSNKYLFNLTKQYRQKIVFEHNTKELEEIASKGLNDDVSKLMYKYEKEYGPKVLANSKGIIAVTNEICQYELARSNNKTIKSATISNGVDINKFPLRKKPIYDGKTLNLLMLSGSVVNWHGEDLIMKALSKYKGPVKVNFYVVGDVLESSKKLMVELKLEDKVKFIEPLNGSKLDRILMKCTLG